MRPQVGGAEGDPGDAVWSDAARVNVANAVGDVGTGEPVGGGVAEQATTSKATAITRTGLTTMSIAKSYSCRKAQTAHPGTVQFSTTTASTSTRADERSCREMTCEPLLDQ